MNVIVMGSALVAGAVAELAWPAWTVLGQAKAPILLGVVLYYALARSGGLMLTAALLGGVLADSLAALPLGVTALSFCGVGGLARLGRGVLFGARGRTHMYVGACAAAVCVGLVYCFLCVRAPELRALPLRFVGVKAIGAALLGLAVTPLVYLGLQGVERMMGNVAAPPAEAS